MEKYMYRTYSENKPTILMGDAKMDFLSEKIDKLTNSWISLQKLAVSQIIKGVTDTNETLIDHIHVSDDLPVVHSAPIKYSISDKFPVFAIFQIKNNDHNKREGRQKTIPYKYTSFSPDALLMDLQNTPWLPPSVANISTDEYLQMIICTFTKKNKHFPLVTKRTKKNIAHNQLNSTQPTQNHK